jgi:ribose 1,5-bisphosphokinase
VKSTPSPLHSAQKPNAPADTDPEWALGARLLYVVGPSGAGKDSVIDALMHPLAPSTAEAAPLHRARRTITRPPEAGGETHESASDAEFEQSLAQDAFALAWRANGLGYGIRHSELVGLPGGQWVLVNGSRGDLPRVIERFPALWVVHISASPRVLEQRLTARGRETPQRIQARLQRTAELGAVVHHRVIEINNDTTLDAATEALAEALRQLPGWPGGCCAARHRTGGQQN